MSPPEYLKYVENEAYMRDYAAYQRRYAAQMRESDKVLVEMVRGIVEARGNRETRLLDIGCSTGNLLVHLKRLVPGLSLLGGDMAAEVIAECRGNPELSGVEFREMNVLALPDDRPFDVVVANAVLWCLAEPEFEQALASIARSLTAG